MRFINILLSTVFPHHCPFCGTVMAYGERSCTECAPRLPLITGEICKRCGRGIQYCNCKGKRLVFERCVAPLYYEDLARRGIARFKFYGKPSSAESFASFAADTVRREYNSAKIDFVTSVPLTVKEMKKRGFNQSALFGRTLARKLGLPYREVLLKPRDVRPQRSLTAHERWGNVSGAFTAKGIDVKGRTILLADDIMTTGATLSECAGVLKNAGAAQVLCTVIACVRINA